MEISKVAIDMSMKEEIWVEVPWWYDWIAFFLDKGKKYSRVAHLPLEDDELCKYWRIYKVKPIGEYYFKILSEREDKK